MGINPSNRGVRVQSGLNVGNRHARLRQYRPVSRALRSDGKELFKSQKQYQKFSNFQFLLCPHLTPNSKIYLFEVIY